MTSSAQDLLLDAAERLVAERGLQVSLREVGVVAGQRNNSAVQYHFGSRDGLVEAVVQRRMVALEARRLELLAEHEVSGHPDDLRELISILVGPMLDQPYREGATHYARFLEQARSHPLLSDRLGFDSDEWPATRLVISRLGRALTHLRPEQRRLRLRCLATTTFALLADRERAAVGGAALGADAALLTLAELVSVLGSILTAPVAQPAH